MKRQLLLALLAAGLAAAPGCADKRDAVPGIRITPSIKTRVTGLHFDTGDCIGLTVTKNGSDYVRNHQMTYDGSAFTASGLLWYNDLNETSTLTAYFPYSASGVPDEFSVARDQSAGCASSDLLGAVAKNVTPTGAPVGMLFYHLMSQLTIVITNNSDAAVSGVAVGGFVPTASVDLSVPTASAKAGVAAAEIETFEVTPDASYRAILVPQQGALTVTVSTRDGKSRSKTLSSATLESGRRYDMSVLVTNIDIELKLSGEVSDWEDGGSLDEGDGGEASELEYGGDTYRTAKIGGQVWMAENLRYQPAGTEIGDGVWYPEEGLSAVAEKGMLYDYKTVTGGATVRDSAAGHLSRGLARSRIGRTRSAPCRRACGRIFQVRRILDRERYVEQVRRRRQRLSDKLRGHGRAERLPGLQHHDRSGDRRGSARIRPVGPLRERRRRAVDNEKGPLSRDLFLFNRGSGRRSGCSPGRRPCPKAAIFFRAVRAAESRRSRSCSPR